MQKVLRLRNWLVLCAAVMLIFSVTPVLAATNVTGNWTGSMNTQDGNSFTLTFSFKQDGQKLTGTVEGPQGQPMDIENGKVDGNKLSFDVSFNGMTITHEGTIDGNEIKMTTKSQDGQMPPMNFTLTREKAAAAQ